jgi:hypothetical protein
MLSGIVAHLQAVGRPLCVAEMSRDLGIDEPALEGMLETLVQRGRLRIIDPGAADCRRCPARAGCFILRSDAVATFALARGPLPASDPGPPAASRPGPPAASRPGPPAPPGRGPVRGTAVLP